MAQLLQTWQLLCILHGLATTKVARRIVTVVQMRRAAQQAYLTMSFDTTKKVRQQISPNKGVSFPYLAHSQDRAPRLVLLQQA